jgi:hypothetical protein
MSVIRIIDIRLGADTLIIFSDLICDIYLHLQLVAVLVDITKIIKSCAVESSAYTFVSDFIFIF